MKKRFLLRVVGVWGFLPACFGLSQSLPADRLRINELYYNTDKKSQEWIELYNPSAHHCDLAHWSIRDSRKRVELAKSPFIVPGYTYVVISNAALDDSLQDRTLVVSLPEWNNGGDEIVLYDAQGQVSDSLVYQSDWGGGRFISLERLRWDGDSCDPHNWASSIDLSGHTAGRSNSVHAPESSKAKISLTVAPSPFSPDLDGMDDQAAISYELPMTHAIVHIKIYDLAGRLVRYLCNTKASGPQDTVWWDGSNEQGQRCPLGVYIVFLQAIDESAGRVEQAKQVCVLAERL